MEDGPIDYEAIAIEGSGGGLKREQVEKLLPNLYEIKTLDKKFVQVEQPKIVRLGGEPTARYWQIPLPKRLWESPISTVPLTLSVDIITMKAVLCGFHEWVELKSTDRVTEGYWKQYYWFTWEQVSN